MNTVMSITHVLPDLIQTLPQGGVPNPGRGEAPPGSDGLVTMLRWAMWIASGMCVLGVLIAGGSMALALNGRGNGGGEHVTKLGWALAGCIVIGSASALVAALL